MKKLTMHDLDDLAIGCAILGSGGGGDPRYSSMMTKHAIEKYGPVSLINTSDVKDKDFILPIGFSGAPLAEMEKIASGREIRKLVSVLEKTLGKKVNFIMPLEIGGMNAFVPLIAGAQLGIPVLDADMIGRAFPGLEMCSYLLTEPIPPPGAIADCLDNIVIIHATNGDALERIGRQIFVAMGSAVVDVLYPIQGSQVSTCTIPKSIFKAIAIGKAHRKAKAEGKDPVDDILTLCKGALIGSGRIIDIDRVIAKAYVKGNVIIQNKSDRLELFFQNEFLVAKSNGEIVATTPDILTLLEQDTGTPVTSETLQYGLKVNLLALPSPEVWTTPAGLAKVGPRHFGYDIDYQPFYRTKAKKSLIEKLG